ncbi:methyltransferase domain-containing protein [Candidatus Parcubacteria bacterium]|nr:methyltransferase domain-containing protein [Candidatus Parcubacteria bacterium]
MNSYDVPDFLNINEVLEHLEIKPGMIAVEFGSGSADFTLALAKKAYQGRVYALDIEEQKLSALKSKLNLQKLNNIATVCCDLETPGGSTLKSNSCNIVVIPNFLFQTENKHAILKEVYRILLPDSQCLVIDWLKQNPLHPKEHLLDPDEVKNLAQATGFSLKEEFAAGDYHYGLLFIKK